MKDRFRQILDECLAKAECCGDWSAETNSHERSLFVDALFDVWSAEVERLTKERDEAHDARDQAEAETRDVLERIVRAHKRGRAEERAKVVAWLRSTFGVEHWISVGIENGEHDKDGGK